MLRILTLVVVVIASFLIDSCGLGQEASYQPFYGGLSAQATTSGGFQLPGSTAGRRKARKEKLMGNTCPEDRLVVNTFQSISHLSGPTVPGDRAVIRRGLAYAPANAPDQIKRAIWATNRIVGARYKWGGGHASFTDDGYDCSGTVSYALHHAGLIVSPMGSSELTQFGSRGCGRWITVYARRGHVFAIIAGLRLDTTDLRRGGDVGPRWHLDGRDTSSFEARRVTGA